VVESFHGDEEATTLVPSGNGRVLFGESPERRAASRLATMACHVDPHRHRRSRRLAESLSTIGSTGAIDDVLGGLIYRTRDGRTWTALPNCPRAHTKD